MNSNILSNDKIIIQDNHHKVEQNNLINNKIIKSCHRYSKQWLDYSEGAYDIKMKDFPSLKVRLVEKLELQFTTNSAKDRWDEIFNLISDIKNTDKIN